MANGWRRSFNWFPGGADNGQCELMQLKANEVLLGCWWQFHMTLSYNGTGQPTGNSPGKVGLWLENPNFTWDPFSDPNAGYWLDMPPITWVYDLSRSTDVDWFCWANMGPTGRKAKSMRKLTSDLSIGASYHVYGNGTPTGWSDGLQGWVTADAYIGNVQA